MDEGTRFRLLIYIEKKIESGDFSYNNLSAYMLPWKILAEQKHLNLDNKEVSSFDGQQLELFDVINKLFWSCKQKLNVFWNLSSRTASME